MLNGQQSLADSDLFDQADKITAFAAAHAGGRFIQQNDWGTACYRDAYLQGALLRIGEIGGQHVAFSVQLDHAHQFQGALIRVLQVSEKLPEAVPVAHAPKQAAAQVFKHAELGKNMGDLEAAAQSRPVDLVGLFAINALTIEKHLSAAGRKAPADQVEQG